MEDCIRIVVVLAVLEEVFAGERGLVCEERDLDRANRRVERGRRSGIGLAGVLGGHGGQVSYRLMARATSKGRARSLSVFGDTDTPLECCDSMGWSLRSKLKRNVMSRDIDLALIYLVTLFRKIKLIENKNGHYFFLNSTLHDTFCIFPAVSE